MEPLSINFLDTIFVIIFILLIDFIVEYLLVKKIKNKKQSLKLRVLTRYVVAFCFFFFMAKIWVEGFGYLLTFVGVISVGFTITQKEYLMNVVGWLIIMWRDLFVEGDYIEIGEHKGFVQHIRPLYFTLEEASTLIWGERTGRVIKVPNMYVSNHPFINFSVENQFLEGFMPYTFTFDSSYESVKNLACTIEQELELLFHELYHEWATRNPKEYAHIKQTFQIKPKGLLKISQSYPAGYLLRIRFVALRSDHKYFERVIYDQVIEKLLKKEPLVLATSVFEEKKS
jgi:small-conductance mechanosensitive channel